MVSMVEEQTGQTAQTFQQRKFLGGGLPCRKKTHTLCVTIQERALEAAAFYPF